MDSVQNSESYVNIPSSQTFTIQVQFVSSLWKLQLLTWIEKRSAIPPAFDVNQQVTGCQQVECEAGSRKDEREWPVM
jgi:hypothetical protein